MNYFSKIKIGTWIVIILTVINLASLATIIYKISIEHPPVGPMGKEPQKQKGVSAHWRQLNLSPGQDKKFREMGKKYFDSVRIINRLRDTLANRIASELKKDNPNKALMYKYSQEMGENYTRGKQLTINHLINLKKQCRADQVHKLDSMYNFLLIGFERQRRNREDRKSTLPDSLHRNNKRPINKP
jgi:hypothetical protein